MIQICQDGQWVAVCDYGWTQTHSIVVCKELGYNNPSENRYIHIYLTLVIKIILRLLSVSLCNLVA